MAKSLHSNRQTGSSRGWRLGRGRRACRTRKVGSLPVLHGHILVPYLHQTARAGMQLPKGTSKINPAI